MLKSHTGKTFGQLVEGHENYSTSNIQKQGYLTCFTKQSSNEIVCQQASIPSSITIEQFNSQGSR